MKTRLVYEIFIYFLCFSFLLLTGGFPRMAAEAKEGGLPIAQMVSSGEVKFEAREDVWKEVEPAHFPIFQGVRIKTEKGLAFIVLPDDTQIQVGNNSLFSFQDDQQFHLFQGRVSFRIPSGAETSFMVGKLSIRKSLSVQAAKSPLPSRASEETVGSITLRPNGSATVTGIRGPLSVRGPDHVLLAAISPKQSVTIPSAAVLGEQRPVVAQVGEYPTEEAVPEEFYGLSKTTWFAIGLAAVAAAGGGIAIASAGDDDHEYAVPTCP